MYKPLVWRLEGKEKLDGLRDKGDIFDTAKQIDPLEGSGLQCSKLPWEELDTLCT